MQHLLVYTPIVQWPVHFETDLEIALQHLDRGWKVTFLHCRGALPVCAQNIKHHKSVCRKCVSRFERGIKWLGRDRVDVLEFQSLSAQQQEEVAALAAKPWASLDEVESFVVDGAEIGLAALGSLISCVREPRPDLAANRKMLIDHLQAALMVYYSIRNRISELRADAVVLFNGRFTETRAALQAAQSLKTSALVHERAGVLDMYCVTRDAASHNIAVMKGHIEDNYRDSDLDEVAKVEIAREWYRERWSHKEQNWYSFAADQKHGVLPDYDGDRCNLVIFNSSEDENVAFPEWRNPFYLDQNEGVRRIVSELRGDRRFKLFLRVHPNLKGVVNSQTEGLARLPEEFPELTLIPAESPVSTYGILDTCDLVLVFGSTVGVESAFAGKPTFLMGRSYYEDLGCCVTPKSHDELMGLLSRFAAGQRDMLPAKEKVERGTAIYGFFNKAWGERYRYVTPCHVGRSVLVRNGKETVLRPSIASWLIDKILAWGRV